MRRATKARVLGNDFTPFAITRRSRQIALGHHDFLRSTISLVFASLRCVAVDFSLRHNPRNASMTTDPRVMAGAIGARGNRRLLTRYSSFPDKFAQKQQVLTVTQKRYRSVRLSLAIANTRRDPLKDHSFVLEVQSTGEFRSCGQISQVDLGFATIAFQRASGLLRDHAHCGIASNSQQPKTPQICVVFPFESPRSFSPQRQP